MANITKESMSAKYLFNLKSAAVGIALDVYNWLIIDLCLFTWLYPTLDLGRRVDSKSYTLLNNHF